MFTSRALAVCCLTASVAVGTGCRPTAPAEAPVGSDSALHVYAEGPCARLSLQTAGPRRFLVYGDTGYGLYAWAPGEKLAAAQSLVELRDDGAYRKAAWTAGLPSDARGYVYGQLELGGSFDRDAWLVRIVSHYSDRRRGPLFERRAEGYLFRSDGWTPHSGNPVTLPAGIELPSLPDDACQSVAPDLSLVPLASGAYAGGVLIAGRCDDAAAMNYAQTTLLVAHGEKDWTLRRLPETDALDGIVNVSIDAPSSDRAHLVVYEPFVARHERQAYLARFDGDSWREVAVPIDDGLMDVAEAEDGLWLAGGRDLYFRHDDGNVERVRLPPLRHADSAPDSLHIHSVHQHGGHLWVEASYRVVRGDRSEQASALFSTLAPPAPLYCDAAEPAEAALYEVEL